MYGLSLFQSAWRNALSRLALLQDADDPMDSYTLVMIDTAGQRHTVALSVLDDPHQAGTAMLVLAPTSACSRVIEVVAGGKADKSAFPEVTTCVAGVSPAWSGSPLARGVSEPMQ